MKYGQRCWPILFVGIVPAGDHPYFDKIGQAVTILVCGTANIGRVARLALFFTRGCDVAIIKFDA